MHPNLDSIFAFKAKRGTPSDRPMGYLRGPRRCSAGAGCRQRAGPPSGLCRALFFPLLEPCIVPLLGNYITTNNNQAEKCIQRIPKMELKPFPRSPKRVIAIVLVRPRLPPRGPKRPPCRPKTSPKRPQAGPRSPETSPKRSRDAPRRPTRRPKRTQGVPQ